MSFKDKLALDRVDCFNKTRPPDITNELWNMARTHAEVVGSRLSKEVEQSAFYFYYIGDSFEDIATKLAIPMELLVYTAIYFNWFERKNLTSSVRAGSKVKRADAAAIDLITDSIVATAALYKSKLAEAIKNPQAAAECPLIPKNFKELQTLLMMLQSLQTESVEKHGPAINVNIANLPTGNNPPRVIESVDVEALPPADSAINQDGLNSDEKMEILKLLEKVKKQ